MVLFRSDEMSEPRHGPFCSSDPEIGCECGYAEWQSEQREKGEIEAERIADLFQPSWRYEHVLTMPGGFQVIYIPSEVDDPPLECVEMMPEGDVPDWWV